MDALLTPAQFAAFLPVAVLITLAPGPDNLMVLGLGMSRGRESGVAFGLGCAAGCLSHTTLAALGVSALIAASPLAFGALKIAGGLYLLWLGLQALRSARPSGLGPAPALATVEGSGRLFAKGLLANAVNPKVILFFLAFLPQFANAGRGHAGWQIAQLGGLFAVETAIIFAMIGWSAGRLGTWLACRPGLGAWLDRAAGGIFVLLAAKLLVGR